MSNRILLKQRVFFGDCDPVGIVFYPNIFNWFEVKREDALCVSGVEVRGLFRQTEQGMIASHIAPLKEALAPL